MVASGVDGTARLVDQRCVRRLGNGTLKLTVMVIVDDAADDFPLRGISPPSLGGMLAMNNECMGLRTGRLRRPRL